MKDKTHVGYVVCPGCPMKVSLINDEGVDGSPANDRLVSHNYHGKNEQCRSHTILYKSRRQQGQVIQ
ncbi:MAG: hypothetical protein HZB12_02475 [Candidatus Yonathbacteria bacterium]|nr:hypothetical protein [Candidatus Yonathbacteria bacterium]